MCERLLANPVIEAYEVTIAELEPRRESRGSASCCSPARTASSTSMWAVEQLGAHGRAAVARRRDDASGVDAVVVPGGFAHGDYLRTGAIARFSPVMAAVARVRGGRRSGRRHLQRLPGADRGAAPAGRAAEERGLEVPVRDGRAPGRDHATVLTNACEVGDRSAHPDQPLRRQLRVRRRTLAELRAEDRVVVRYVDNPNGSLDDIAGICNDGAQRRRPDAAPRARVRRDARLGRRRRAAAVVCSRGRRTRPRDDCSCDDVRLRRLRISRASGSALVADTFAAPTRALLARPPADAAALRARHGLRAGLHDRAVARGDSRTLRRPGSTRRRRWSTRRATACRARAFAVADVTAPLRLPADVVYARLLLGHLPDPDGRARALGGGAAPGRAARVRGTGALPQRRPVVRALRGGGHRGRRRDAARRSGPAPALDARPAGLRTRARPCRRAPGARGARRRRCSGATPRSGGTERPTVTR